MNSDRTHAVSLAQERLRLLPVYLDTETTGLDKKSEIIEICLIDHENNVLFQSLVKPSTPVPYDVTRIHGITNEMLLGAPNWMRVLPEVQELLLGRYVGNITF
jgi:DNA polymerase-3 subunit epsilon